MGGEGFFGTGVLEGLGFRVSETSAGVVFQTKLISKGCN